MVEYMLLAKDPFGNTYALGKDKLGGKLRADVYPREDGGFKAYAEYLRVEYDDVVGYAESDIIEHALAQSIINLGLEWIKFQEKGII